MKQKFLFLSGAALGLVLSIGLLHAASSVRAAGGSNIISATQCTPQQNGVLLKKYGKTYLLKNGCRNAGHGMRDYTLTCVGSTKYKVQWSDCDTGSTNPVTPPPASNTKPVLSLSKTSEQITAGQSFSYPIATATDAEDGNLTSEIYKIGGVNNTVPGTYVVQYRVTDSDDNTVTRNFVVVVNAAPVVNTPPVLTLSKYNTTVTIDGVYTPPTATATDAQDGNLTSSIVKTGTSPTEDKIGLYSSGTYVETYTVTDSEGAQATATHTINVIPPADCGANGWLHYTEELGDHCHCNAVDGYLEHPSELMCISATDFITLTS